MKLVVEVSDSERAALAKFLSTMPGVPYSALVRTLLRLAIDGTVPRAKLLPALDQRPTINVTVVKEVAHKAPKPEAAQDIYESTGFKRPKK